MSLTQVVIKFTHLGAEWVMWVLVVLSIVSVTVMIERWLFLRRQRVDWSVLARGLEHNLRAGNVPEALRLVADSRASVCVVLAAGLTSFSRGATSIAEIMQSVKVRERLKLESYLTILATLGNNAPFIGLLGTVLGIIKASQDLAAAQAAKQVATGVVMAGVFEALVATAVGLFVAIPAVVAYNLFQRRVRTIMGEADAAAHLLLAWQRSAATVESNAATTTHKPTGVS